jgi:hypothetical protein
MAERHEDVFPRAVESGPDWESREQDLYEQLDGQLQIARELDGIIESTRMDTPPDEVENVLFNFLEKVRLKFPEGARDIKERSALVEELDSLAGETQKIAVETMSSALRDSRLVQEGRVQITRRLLKEVQSIFNEVERISARPHVRLLTALETIIPRLVGKNRLLRRMREDPERLREFAGTFTMSGKPLDEKRVANVHYSPFGVLFILGKDYYDEEISGNSLGKHMRNSPVMFAMVEQDDYSLEDIARHESIHNILDGVAEAGFGGRTKLSTLQRALALYSLSKSVEGVSKTEEFAEIRKEILNYGDKDALNDLHEEVVTHSEIAERAGRDELESDEGVRERRRFEASSSRFATAGYIARKAHGLFQDVVEGDFDEEVKAHYRKLEADFPRTWLKFSKYIDDSVARARSIGSQAHRDVHLLMVLLRPSQYRHIPKYLEWKYGKEQHGEEETSEK